MARSLDQLQVSPALHERARMVWIVTCVGGLVGFFIFKFAFKIDGQEKSRWFKRQLIQSAIVGGLGWLCYPLLGLGYLVHFVLGLLAYTALSKGRDYELPLIGKYLP